MSKIDDLNIQPKFDNALQVQRTANIPDNEKYKASEWNALISKTNEVVGRANLNTWSIVTNYSELPTDPVNGQKVYVTGTGLNGHVSVQMMPNGKTSRGFYVYDAFSDIWVQKTSESELSAITFSIDTNWSGLPDEPNQGDIFELTTNDTPIPANVIGVVDPNESAGKYQFNGTVWVAKSDTVLYQEVLAMLEDKLDLDMSNLAGDLTESEKKVIREKLGAAYEGVDNVNSGEGSGSVGGEINTNSGYLSGSVAGFNNDNSGHFSGSTGGHDLQNQTYAETSRGRYNLSESNHADSATVWHDDDLIESVGGGTNTSNRLNLFARYKSGAFKWLLQPLTNITNAVLGFHAADTDGRLNYYDGTDWKKYLLEGEGSGGGYIEILDQFNDVNGDVDLDLITEEGTYVLMEMRDQDLNGLPQYAGDGFLNVQIDVFKSGGWTHQRAIYFSSTQTKPSIAYRVKYGSDSYTPWVDLYEQIDNKNFFVI